ncbi:type III-B CRISPR module RAMP protein Cmr1 [Cystobacter ferrugineus]|uniref:Type III-B CRISPR module RAMP protein Cmr1 n=2 Tax=Cystobacter ferrugineus TaxID=83449 RepID=A0A1L9AV69_9BACT|nr:type III-B CRISPR module RAMP protein Cmr1 [Cystobacter ferrugineus]
MVGREAPPNLAQKEPPRRDRRYLGGPLVQSFQVRLRTTTPILGGSPEPRQVDTVDVIRVPSIRGHLRFWWRALHGHECPTAQALAERERALWGGVGGEQGTRSRVEVRVEVERASVTGNPDNVKPGDTGAYALWPARASNTESAAPQLNAGLLFQLHLRAPLEHMTEVENTVRAWILWGGYGGRTRRGLGGLTVVDELSRWLPSTPAREDLRKLFHGLPLLGAAPAGGARQVPLLQGARLFHGRTEKASETAWVNALAWLRDFRQDQGPRGNRGEGSTSHFAREWGAPKRPGRSRWPEADKIRALVRKPDGTAWAHVPRAAYSTSREASWPRAGFGLPLATRFQQNARPSPGERQVRPYAEREPDDVELRWHDGKKVRERFASPLIVKAMPLANGTFVPIALWLCRAWPDHGHVVLLRKGHREHVPGSEAPFERLLAPGDTALYAPLRASSLSEAFFSWVKARGAKES